MIPEPKDLGTLTEEKFPGYKPAQIIDAVATRIQTGQNSLRCSGRFFNLGILGSAQPSAAFLVARVGNVRQLVSVVDFDTGSLKPILPGPFEINCNFVWSDT
jgi:hypothetical protein